MTKEERMVYNKAINVIDYKLLGKQGYVGEPTKEQIEAIILAMKSMETRMKETELPLSRHIAVLRYHIKNPTALLFKDHNTLDALEAGIMAMKWLMKDNMYEVL
jgi:hypothetical protein